MYSANLHGWRVGLLLALFAACPAPARAQQSEWNTLRPNERPEDPIREGTLTFRDGYSGDVGVGNKEKEKVRDFGFPVGETPGPIALQGPEVFIGAPGDYPFVYALQYAPKEPVKGQASQFGYLRHDISVGIPLAPITKDYTLAATLGLRWVDYDTTAVFPGTTRKFPTNLYAVDPGIYYRQKLENGFIVGGLVTLGSQSDKPYHSLNELTPSINAFLKVPRTNGDAYLFSFFYQPVGQIRIPIPGFAYQYNPNDDLQINIGLPFDMRWRFLPNWRFELGYVPITAVRANLFYDFGPTGWSLFTGFEWTNDSYLLADRPENRQYLFQYGKDVQAGLRIVATENITADIVAGYAFDRFYFLGKKYSERNQYRIDQGDGPFVQFRVGLRF